MRCLGSARNDVQRVHADIDSLQRLTFGIKEALIPVNTHLSAAVSRPNDLEPRPYSRFEAQ